MMGRRIGMQEEELAAGEEPMTMPVFTETMQVAIVVRDLNVTMRRYIDFGMPVGDLRIQPWVVKNLRKYGQPVERSRRLAVAMLCQVQWEVIEPSQ
jgi:hypothetical protein